MDGWHDECNEINKYKGSGFKMARKRKLHENAMIAKQKMGQKQ